MMLWRLDVTLADEEAHPKFSGVETRLRKALAIVRFPNPLADGFLAPQVL